MVLNIEISEEVWPTQEAFYSEWEHPIVGFIGGWGSGKSYIGAQKAFELSARNKFCAGAVVGPTHGQVMDTTWPTMIAFLESHGVPFYERRGQRPALIMPWGNPERKGAGWIFFRSLDKPGAIKGLNLGWAWLDEAGEVSEGESAWQVLLSRVRDSRATCMQVVLTSTGEAPWLEEKFTSDDDDYVYFKASTRENLALPDSYVKRLEAELPIDLATVYIDGGFLPPQTGRVYSSFDQNINIAPVQYEPGLPLVHTLDFNVHPHCSLVGQVHKGVARVLSEIVLPNSTTEDAAKAFIKRCGGHEAGIHVHGDPSGTARSTNSRRSDYDILREEYRKQFGETNVRFFYRMADPGQHGRVNSTNRMFKASTGAVRLLVHPRCTHLLYDLKRLSWTEDGHIDKKQRNKKYGWTISHCSDGLSYWMEAAFPILKPRVTAA
jgi:hypothetical protein